MSRWLDFTPPGGGIAMMAGCFIVASLWFIVTGGDSWFTSWVCPWFLPIGIGLWLKHSWARWLSFAFFLLVSLALILLCFDRGITARSVIQGLVIAGSLYSLWDWQVYPKVGQTDLGYSFDTLEDNDA